MNKSDSENAKDTIVLYKVDLKDVSIEQDRFLKAGMQFLPDGKFKRIVHGCNPAARRSMSWRSEGRVVSIYIDKTEYTKEKLWMKFEILKLRNSTMLVVFK